MKLNIIPKESVHPTTAEIETVVVEIQLPNGIEQAFDLVTDLEQYPSIHPLITKVERTGPNEYLCHETTRVFMVPYNFCYAVSVSTDQRTGETRMDTEVIKGVNLRLTFSKSANGTLTDRIEVSGPLLVRKILAGKLEQVHTQMLLHIKSAISNQ
jgi:hypothetical protein